MIYMNPVIGQAIVIAVICVIAFFAARATLRNIKAELRGEATCAGCNGCGGNKAECKMCSKSVDELRKLAKERSSQS